MLGVNGAGKTTTCAKLAWRASKQGRKVLLGAADTFRAAGTEQLRMWGENLKVQVVSGQQGSDAAAVAFDALEAAHARGADLLFVDTAGRMHTKSHLMDELQKMVRALQKRDPEAPHATWMVLDASLGQNSLNQARVFHEAVPLSGLILTKLDGSSKAGFLFNIQKELPGVPVLFSGLGEAKEDLVPFDATSFLDALFRTEPDA
jgi:fused signal recognition particle receptor